MISRHHYYEEFCYRTLQFFNILLARHPGNFLLVCQWSRNDPSLCMKTNLITPEGYNQLQKEHDHLWYEKRPEITKIVNWAASLGDRSENADYTFNKRLLRQIDRRVRYLRKRLPDLKIVQYDPQQAGKVYFGAWVEIENEQEEINRFRIVGPDEIYDRKDYISIDAPMARALLGKEVDDEFVVRTPEGEKLWYVNSIEYLK